jgi:hypothetical protein
MTEDARVADLVTRGAELLGDYVFTSSTDTLRELAPVIVKLRTQFTLSNGIRDWGGRTPDYRRAIAELYARARIPDEQLHSVQQALRYHVGNYIREVAPPDELEAAGLKTSSPKDRLATARHAVQAQRYAAAPRQDVARLTTYALDLLEYVDEASIPGAERERLVAARLALEAIGQRYAVLLVRVNDALAVTGRPERDGPPTKRTRGGGLGAI